MIDRNRRRRALVGVLAIAFAQLANAQVSAPTDEDKLTAGPQFKAEVTGNPAYAKFDMPAAPPGAYPTTGPRDFTGVYTTGSAPGGPPPGGPPGGGPGGPGGRPPGPPPGAGPGGGPGNGKPGQICVPTASLGFGGLPTQILMTPGRVTFIEVENHRIRRVYMDASHPKDVKPSYSGDSIGHWEGDTLVIDTIAMRGQEDLHVVQRLRKIEGGRALEIVTTREDKKTGMKTTSTGKGNWRPDVTWTEEICEDFGEAYGEGYVKK